MGRTNSVVVGLASALVLIAGLASAEMLDQDSMSFNETSRQMCADQSRFMVAAAEGKQVPTGEVEERAVPGAPVFPGSSPGRPDLIVASLEKDLDLLEQEVRSAQARLAQPGSNAQEVASASFPKFVDWSRGDPDVNVRKAAVLVLPRFGPKAVAALVDALKDAVVGGIPIMCSTKLPG